jgi:hypothetical protein
MKSRRVSITITVEGRTADPAVTILEPHQAAALARLCEKFGHSAARPYLYPHVAADIRDDQAYHMVHATSLLSDALTLAGVRGWPWIETGAGRAVVDAMDERVDLDHACPACGHAESSIAHAQICAGTSRPRHEADGEPV